MLCGILVTSLLGLLGIGRGGGLGGRLLGVFSWVEAVFNRVKVIIIYLRMIDIAQSQ